MNSAKQLKALQKQLSERDEKHKERQEQLLAENEALKKRAGRS